MSLPPELGKIVAMVPIGDRLYFVAEYGVSSAVMADTIDPQRTNAGIPMFVQQTEFPYGVDTPFVRKTFCTAISLFEQSYMPAGIDCKTALEASLSIARELASLADTVQELQASEASLRQKIEAGNVSARHLPRTANLSGRCSQAIAHLRSIEVGISRLAQMLFPKDKPNDKWATKILKRAEEYFEEGHTSHDVLSGCLTVFQCFSDHRNALIHPDKTKWVKVTDYELGADGNIIAPTIEISHANSAVPRMDVIQFLWQQSENAARAVELFLAIIVEQSEREDHKVFENHVVQLPEGEHRSGSRFVWQTTVKEGQKFP